MQCSVELAPLRRACGGDAQVDPPARPVRAHTRSLASADRPGAWQACGCCGISHAPRYWRRLRRRHERAGRRHDAALHGAVPNG